MHVNYDDEEDEWRQCQISNLVNSSKVNRLDTSHVEVIDARNRLVTKLTSRYAAALLEIHLQLYQLGRLSLIKSGLPGNSMQ